MNGFLLEHEDSGVVEEFIKVRKVDTSRAGLELVSNILRKFSVFPYENLSKIIKLNKNAGGMPHRTPAEILQDNLSFNLGGTCFSLTNFLKKILDYFGFETYIIIADMKTAPNSHCALILNYNGQKYLLDVGYMIFDPLPLEKKVTVGGILSKLLKYDEGKGRYTLFTFDGKRLVERYSFADRPIGYDKFLHFWTESFHWRTMHGICLSKVTEEEFIYLHNRYYKVLKRGRKQKGNLQGDIATAVKDVFGIPEEIVKKAEKALIENIYFDKELGYRVPSWVR
ncbi:MAG: arylamine N-acetyltransferase [Candidatus Marinimicrobia bacterium]|nr:arylamine N-acetyltransferase [Candidatus Neomarinimicrobiota bacterium]HDN60034.1 hypothetical protein [Candidatus Neomarinimicrobiota bacterium]